MSFISGIKNGASQEHVFLGANAPKTGLDHSALMVARTGVGVMSNNAPAQNYLANRPGNARLAPTQILYLNGLIRIKKMTIKPGGATWVGKMFG